MSQEPQCAEPEGEGGEESDGVSDDGGPGGDSDQGDRKRRNVDPSWSALDTMKRMKREVPDDGDDHVDYDGFGDHQRKPISIMSETLLMRILAYFSTVKNIFTLRIDPCAEVSKIMWNFIIFGTGIFFVEI